MSDYRTVLSITAAAVTKRARAFRNLIVAVVLIGLAAIGGMIALLSLHPASVLLLIPGMVQVFLWYDQDILRRWRRDLGSAWMRHNIDYTALRHALVADPVLPRSTVEAMLNTLPRAGELRAEQQVSACTREAVVQAVNVRDDWDLASGLGMSLTVTCGALTCICAILSEHLSLLLGLGLVPLILATTWWLRRQRLAGGLVRIRRLSENADFDHAAYAAIMGELDWEPSDRADRVRLLSVYTVHVTDHCANRAQVARE